jgi:hypothetical protein
MRRGGEQSCRRSESEQKQPKATESKAKVKAKAVRRARFLISVFGMNWRVHCHIQREHDAFQNRPTTKPLCSKRSVADAWTLWWPPSPE